MTEAEQILTILEEVLKGIEDVKKKQPKDDSNNFAPINEKLTSVEAQISIIKQMSGQSVNKGEIGQIMVGIEEIKQIRQKEVRHVYVDVKNPLVWIITTIVIMLISFGVCYYFVDQNKKITQEKDFYKRQSDIKDWNYMKYKYLELFGDNNTVHTLKAFDKEYEKGWENYDKQTRKREGELDEAGRARKEAELKAGESKRLQKQADSLQGIK